jgi:hypothetical protein
MKLIIATHNPAKVLRYKHLLSQFPTIAITSLREERITTKLEEPHSTSLENAMHKARSYATLTQELTLGIDEGVTTNFLPPDEQPGVFVRRVSKDRRELSDQEVLDHWREVFTKYPPGDKKFIWDFSIALCDPHTGKVWSTAVEQRSVVAPFFSKQIDPGYPMSSFLMHEETTKPYVELSNEERAFLDRKTFKPFIDGFGEWITELLETTGATPSL